MANNTITYGFIGLEHLFSQRVTSENIQVIREALTQSVAEHNRQVGAIMSELAGRTTAYSARFTEPVSGTLQPLDEYGNPLPVRHGGYYDVAFPIQGGGTAWGENRVTRGLMTVEEVNDYTLAALGRDADWMKRHMLAALFDNGSWTFDDPQHGNLTIQPLANGDTAQFLRRNGAVSTDTHYLAQAGAIANDANPFPTIYSELMEHPVNAGAEVVAYVPTNLVSTVTALTAFDEVRDPDVLLGSGSSQLVGSIDRGFGDEMLGKVSKVWVVEWSQLPDNYMLAVARGSARPALWMREYPAATLQGLFQEEHSPDGNLQEHRFIRYAGFGAYNRVGALAYRIGDAAYATPTGYSTPLAV